MSMKKDIERTEIEMSDTASFAKTYAIDDYVVLYQDGDNQDLVLQVKNPVPIYSEEKKLLGFANISARGVRVMANGSIAYDSPERLEIETGMKYYLNPILEELEPNKSKIKGLEVSRTPTDKRSAPIRHV